jgi:hypothetical protein
MAGMSSRGHRGAGPLGGALSSCDPCRLQACHNSRSGPVVATSQPAPHASDDATGRAANGGRGQPCECIVSSVRADSNLRSKWHRSNPLSPDMCQRVVCMWRSGDRTRRRCISGRSKRCQSARRSATFQRATCVGRTDTPQHCSGVAHAAPVPRHFCPSPQRPAVQLALQQSYASAHVLPSTRQSRAWQLPSCDLSR